MRRRLVFLAFLSVFLPIPGQAQNSLTTDCIINANARARIGAPVEGTISAIHVERGAAVRIGDLIAELEASEERSKARLARLRAESDIRIRTAEHRLEVAEEKAGRFRSLKNKNVASAARLEEVELEESEARMELERSRLDLELAKIEAEAAEDAVERKKIRSPMNGVVVERVLSPGEHYNQEEPLLILAGIDPLYVETYLPASRQRQIRLGDTYDVVLETGSTVAGTVAVVDPILDPATGTFGVRLTVPNPDRTVLAGQRCSINFD